MPGTAGESPNPLRPRPRSIPTAASFIGLLIAALALGSGPARAQFVQWQRQFGSAVDDKALGTTSDGSHVYTCGYTEGQLLGQTSQGLRDAYVRKYDLAGNVVWQRQFGESITLPGAVNSAINVVPEPAGCMLMILLALATTVVIRWKR